MAHHALQFIFHARRQVGTRLEEIFKIRRREDQHFTRTVGTIEVGPLPRFEHIGPTFEILDLLFLAAG
ncbi:Uncharacterised protein [Kluyvera cryocrescens]|uniref:Uncharacterized protein n=1 Tax=Kluyvera cryocrescens TaxID=580 RepID=A0A485D3R8_KLUCR|nr:Uncharacterised protein [Kluyvera cryocrescens]